MSAGLDADQPRPRLAGIDWLANCSAGRFMGLRCSAEVVRRFHGSSRRWGVFVIGALLVACNAGGTDATTDGSTSDTGDGSDTGTGALPILGAPCDHGGDLEFDGDFHVSRDEGCAGGICSYVVGPRAHDCVVDADCGVYPEPGAYVCVAGGCVTSEAYRRERSMCSQGCEADRDCLPVDLSTTCAVGIACVIASPDCCEKLCLCLDELSQGAIDEATNACAADMKADCPR